MRESWTGGLLQYKPKHKPSADVFTAAYALSKQTLQNVNMCENWCTTCSEHAYIASHTSQGDQIPRQHMLIINARISFLSIWMICQAGNILPVKKSHGSLTASNRQTNDKNPVASLYKIDPPQHFLHLMNGEIRCFLRRFFFFKSMRKN